MSIADYNATVPNNVRRILSEKGMKQCVVAERAGLSNQQLSDMLAERKIIKACDIIALAKALGVQVNDLFVAAEAEGRRFK